jgi:hypothetical protein
MSRHTDTLSPFARPILATGEHLTAYGHRMAWTEDARQANGQCERCFGRVLLYLDVRGQVVASADPQMIAVGEDFPGLDYAECPRG